MFMTSASSSSTFFFFLRIRRPPRSTLSSSSAASDVYKRQPFNPTDTLSTASLGGHLASTLEQFKQINAPLSGVKKASTLDYYQRKGGCDPKLGYLWEPTGGASLTKPLSLYYTSGGQIAGLRLDIWGADAAQGLQIANGYYIKDGTDHWHLSMSFRAVSEMCSGATSSETVGDRLIINQDTIAKSVPMTSSEALAANFMPGSCMTSMGQHHFYDLSVAPGNSWISGNLLPIVPMYHAAGSPHAGKINAFFFASPTCQGPNNKGSSTAYSWDNVPDIIGCALPPSAMCENFCAKDCSTDSVFGANPWKSSGTKHWGTFHIFFNSDPKHQPTCPGYSALKNVFNIGAIPFGRTCPANTQTPNTNLEAITVNVESNGSDGGNSALVAVVVVLVVAGVMGVAAALVVWKRRSPASTDVMLPVCQDDTKENYQATGI
eukprot:TRINITY_DN3392_c0_g1_i3.p1 TRINITY_DN3392_c0_g1~~TRINITY_DN3392_c0_g1_i3.p1  ORF type:complete len:433 (+),score=92.46 TRINITY_DN3392_c0_g1_i3:36-1334(+)